MKFMKVVCCLLNNFWCDSSDSFIGAEPLDVRRNETFCWDPRYFSVVERSVVSCAIFEPDDLKIWWVSSFLLCWIMFMMMLESFLLVVVFMDVHVSSKWTTIIFGCQQKPSTHLVPSGGIPYIHCWEQIQMNINISIFVCVFGTPPSGSCDMWKACRHSLHQLFNPIASIYGNMDPM